MAGTPGFGVPLRGGRMPRSGGKSKDGEGMTRFGPTSHSFMSQRTRLHYVDWGNHDAPLLILLHGNRDHCRSWDWTAEALRERWHVVAPDLRGHGDSDWSQEGRYDFAGFVCDLDQLIFELGGQPAAIMAHSMGGHVALRYAGLFPESVTRLIAVEAVGAPPEQEEEQKRRSLSQRYRTWIDTRRAAAGRPPRIYGSVEDAQRRMQTENAWLSDAQARHLTLHGLRRTEDGGHCWKFDNCLGLWPPVDHPQEEVFALWQRIACPVLLMYGTESWPSSMGDDLMRTVGDVRRVDLGGAGHWLHHDSFDRFMAEVQAFL